MKPVLVDTGAWIAAVEPADRLHAAASAFLTEIVRKRVPLVTTNCVISETATRLRYDSGTKTMLAFRTHIDRAVASGRLRVVWIDEAIHDEAWKLLERYADVRLSMTDATSAAVARASKITTVFGFDTDFRTLGFVLQPS